MSENETQPEKPLVVRFDGEKIHAQEGEAWRDLTEDEKDRVFAEVHERIDHGHPPLGQVPGGGIFGEPTAAQLLRSIRERIYLEHFDTLILDGAHRDVDFELSGRGRAFNKGDRIGNPALTSLYTAGMLSSDQTGVVKDIEVHIAGDFTEREKQAIVAGTFAKLIIGVKPQTEGPLVQVSEPGDHVLRLGIGRPDTGPDYGAIRGVLPDVLRALVVEEEPARNPQMLAAIRDGIDGIFPPGDHFIVARQNFQVDVTVTERVRTLLPRATLFRVVAGMIVTRDVQ